MEEKTKSKGSTIVSWLMLFVGMVIVIVTAVNLFSKNQTREDGAGMVVEVEEIPNSPTAQIIEGFDLGSEEIIRSITETPEPVPTGVQTNKSETAVAITSKPDSTLNDVAAVGPNCRYGVTPLGNDQAAWVSTLKAGWYLDYKATPMSLATNDAEYVHVVAVNQDFDGVNYFPTYRIYPPLTDTGLGAQIDAQPGDLWIFGNEIEVTVQGNLFPDVYARAYNEFYRYVKDRDPTATVGIGPLAQITPGRLQYLDIMWNTHLQLFGYPMQIDVWTYHIYILPEYNDKTGLNADGKVALGTDVALAKLLAHADPNKCPQIKVYCRAEHDDIGIFAEQTVALRTWMKEHGEQNKPLILAEYSILYPFEDYDDPINPTMCYLMDEKGKCFTAARIKKFMNASFNYLETATSTSIGYPNDNYRLVQQWMWFGLWKNDDFAGGTGSLLLKDNYPSFAPGSFGALSEIGVNFYNAVTPIPLNSNLYARSAKSAIGTIIAPSNTATVTLSVEFYNNGNSSIKNPFQVSFYADQAMTQLIGAATVTPDPQIYGCARQTYTASVLWSNLAPGSHKYWVKVDSGNVIVETNSNDNTATGLVLIDPEPVFLPMLMKN